jgi:fluoroquinolone resistance protein
MMILTETSYAEQTFKDLEMAKAHLKGTTFQECTFEHCTFAEAVFQNCRFTGCVFKNSDLSLAQVPNTTFARTRFESTKLIGINWAQALWPDISIGNPLEFKKCALSHATFLGIDLGAIKLQRCEVINVDFREANLSQADFAFSDLQDSLFQATNLSGADLRYARNYQIDPSHNNIHKAKFSMPEAMALLYSMDIEIIEA